jgi:hypothetical protein
LSDENNYRGVEKNRPPQRISMTVKPVFFCKADAQYRQRHLVRVTAAKVWEARLERRSQGVLKSLPWVGPFGLKIRG